MTKAKISPDTHQSKPALYLCRYSELVDGESRGFTPRGEKRDTMFVVKRNGCLFAYRNNCPHYNNVRLNYRKDAYLNCDHSKIMCSAHGALFDIEDGVCTLGPCLGQKLEPILVEVLNGEVWIVGPIVSDKKTNVKNLRPLS